MAGPGKEFMAKLVGWFDQTIDRVDAAYTARVRIWTAMFSIALMVVVHLDIVTEIQEEMVLDHLDKDLMVVEAVDNIIPVVVVVQEELVVQDQIYQMVVPVYFFLQ